MKSGRMWKDGAWGERGLTGKGRVGGWMEVRGEGVVEVGARGGDDRRKGGAAIRRRRRWRRSEVSATAAAIGRPHW